MRSLEGVRYIVRFDKVAIIRCFCNVLDDCYLLKSSLGLREVYNKDLLYY